MKGMKTLVVFEYFEQNVPTTNYHPKRIQCAFNMKNNVAVKKDTRYYKRKTLTETLR